MPSRQGNTLRKGTYAHVRPTDILGVTIDTSALPVPRPTINSTANNGFDSIDTTAISFDNGTRTFTISPTGDSFHFWCHGEYFLETEAHSVVIDDIEGLHFIHFESTGELISDTIATADLADIIIRNAFVAVVYWDTTNSQAILINDERHGRMDGQTHLYLHTVFGTQWVSGLALGNMTVDGSGASNISAQFSVSDGAIRDEDILNQISDGDPQELSPIAQIPLFYRSGASGLWRKITATNFPVTTAGSGRAAYNQFTGATWQLTEVPTANFLLMHYFATDDINHPIIGIIGQSFYGNKADAEAAANTEISNLMLETLDILAPELKAIATVIWQTSSGYSNAVLSRIVSTDSGDNYVDWRSNIRSSI